MSRDTEFVDPRWYYGGTPASDRLARTVEYLVPPTARKDVIYLVGSLRNPKIPEIANTLREKGFEVFDDWYAAGPEADDYWRDYEKARGSSYRDALRGHAGRNVFNFDRSHLDRATLGLLVMPAGKSGHLELGWLIGAGKPGYVLFDEVPERYDVMYQFCNDVFFDVEECVDGLASAQATKYPRNLAG